MRTRYPFEGDLASFLALYVTTCWLLHWFVISDVLVFVITGDFYASVVCVKLYELTMKLLWPSCISQAKSFESQSL